MFEVLFVVCIQCCHTSLTHMNINCIDRFIWLDLGIILLNWILDCD